MVQASFSTALTLGLLLFNRVIAFCESQTPGLTNLPATSVASCICSSQIGSLSWGPSSFDQAVASCLSQVSGIPAASGFLSVLSTVEGFCTTYYHPQTGALPTPTPTPTSTATAEVQSQTSTSATLPTPSNGGPTQTPTLPPTSVSGGAVVRPTANPNAATKVKAGWSGAMLSAGAAAMLIIFQSGCIFQF